jgi:hypothetical protein
MNTKLIAFVPTTMLILAVVYSQISGNDKAPFIVLSVLGINAVLLVLSAAAFITGIRQSQTWIQFGYIAAPTIYAVLVILMARLGWVNSSLLLGFR